MAGLVLVRPLWPPVAACLAGCLVAGGSLHADDIDRWLVQLGDGQYARREAAARSLLAAGKRSVGPLERTIREGDLESASRGIEVVRDLLVSDDPDTAEAAEQSLDRLATEAPSPVSRLAAQTLEFHRMGMADEARELLESKGAVLRTRNAVDGRGIDVEFAAAWRGTPDDFRRLARLRGVVSVSMHGVPVDASMLLVLGSLSGVQRIDLFGAGVGEDAAAVLTKQLPDARIDVRKGGRLGVSSLAFGGPCEIRTVEPGSAADQAGLRSGDVVLSIDGTEVSSFEDLTRRLGDSAPGEVVQLVVSRRDGTADGEPARIECDVRLDAW